MHVARFVVVATNRGPLAEGFEEEGKGKRAGSVAL
jgi:hypothetical protein